MMLAILFQIPGGFRIALSTAIPLFYEGARDGDKSNVTCRNLGMIMSQ